MSRTEIAQKRTIITEARRRYKALLRELKKEEGKYARLARKYEAAAKVMMAQNSVVGKISEKVATAWNEVEFYEQKLVELRNAASKKKVAKKAAKKVGKKRGKKS